MSAGDAVGFAVAGGLSRRMGRDKALLPWGNGTLLDHTLERLRAVCAEVRILSGSGARYADRGVPVDLDTRPGAGPLGALADALAVAAPRPALLLGIDLPFVSVDLLAHLRDALEGWDAAVPCLEAGAEPLCAAYAAACLGPVQGSLSAGERRMTAFWPHARVHRLAEAELAPFGRPERLFRNVNDASDYAAARADSSR